MFLPHPRNAADAVRPPKEQVAVISILAVKGSKLTKRFLAQVVFDLVQPVYHHEQGPGRVVGRLGAECPE